MVVAYIMIRTFKNRALADVWNAGRSAKIDARMVKRIRTRLVTLNAAANPEDMTVPGFDFHALRGFRPIRYSVDVNGPWCITFIRRGRRLQSRFRAIPLSHL